MTLPDAKQLHRLYVVERKTIREIARLYHSRTTLLLAAMDAAGIARRRPGRQRASLPAWDSDKLHQLVKANGLQYARDFARQHGVNKEKLTVLLGGQSLDRGRRRQQVAVEHDSSIRSAYDTGESLNSLAARYGCTRRAISYSLDRTIHSR